MTRIIRLSELYDSTGLQQFVAGGAVSIGNFDGVHLGHGELLKKNRKMADEVGGPSVAVVLDPHPAVILRPDKAPPKLSSIEQRAERMEQFGVDALVVCETTTKFLQLTAKEFFEVLVVGQLDAEAMVEGPNFFFGRDRGGDIKVLAELCQQHGVELRIVEPTESGSQMISSTRIRSLLANGEVSKAAELLGDHYRIDGTVESGASRGRSIGFPTANLTDIEMVVPAIGVYAASAISNQQHYKAAVHIGPNPTFETDTAVKVEVHLLDFDDDIYGQTLSVDFVARVRDIAQFESVEELIDQLNCDIANVRSILELTPPQ